MRIDYGTTAKGLTALTLLGMACCKVGKKEEEGENKATKAWVTKDFARNVAVILSANIAAKSGLVCNQVATTVQIFVGLNVLGEIVNNYAPKTVGYTNALTNIIGGAAIATVFANRDFSINKF